MNDPECRPHGPYQTPGEAATAAEAAYDAIRTEPLGGMERRNIARLRQAARGVALGAFDQHVLAQLSHEDPAYVEAVAALLERVRYAGSRRT